MRSRGASASLGSLCFRVPIGRTSSFDGLRPETNEENVPTTRYQEPTSSDRAALFAPKGARAWSDWSSFRHMTKRLVLRGPPFIPLIESLCDHKVFSIY